jgi:hypothetical protein
MAILAGGLISVFLALGVLTISMWNREPIPDVKKVHSVSVGPPDKEFLESLFAFRRSR